MNGDTDEYGPPDQGRRCDESGEHSEFRPGPDMTEDEPVSFDPRDEREPLGPSEDSGRNIVRGLVKKCPEEKEDDLEQKFQPHRTIINEKPCSPSSAIHHAEVRTGGPNGPVRKSPFHLPEHFGEEQFHFFPGPSVGAFIVCHTFFGIVS